MHELAYHLVQLNGALEHAMFTAGSQPDQSEVLFWLRGLETTAKGLRGSALQSNHPVLDRHLDTFVQAVQHGVEAAEATPPRFLPAARVGGACGTCHAQRQ